MKSIQTDVLVCGGGCAGIAAALSAARNGAKTLMVERAGFSGGIITTVGLPYFDGLIDKLTGRFVVKGVALELLVAMGTAKPGAKHRDDCRPELAGRSLGNTVMIPNTDEFKLLADSLIKKERENLSVLYHSMACDVECKGGRIDAVIVANKDGLTRVVAKQIVDCTGDADIAPWAGCPTEKLDPLMPMTMHFRIGNVKPNKDMNFAGEEGADRGARGRETSGVLRSGIDFCLRQRRSVYPRDSRGRRCHRCRRSDSRGDAGTRGCMDHFPRMEGACSGI